MELVGCVFGIPVVKIKDVWLCKKIVYFEISFN